jgi:hypothetical protein
MLANGSRAGLDGPCSVRADVASLAAMKSSACRFCSTKLEDTVVDLGMSPLCESFLAENQLDGMEAFYPLHVRVCPKCFLVQLSEYVRPEEIFTEYAYFSSFSTAWLKHAQDYVEMITRRLSLNDKSFVVELASNDGYLLQYFVQQNIPCLGVEPAANVAKVARDERGVETDVAFFNVQTAETMKAAGKSADLILGNNVLAQVPDLNSFIAGLPIILKPTGTVTFEFPHLMRLFEGNQFDTIYHEHFSYFSLLTIELIFAKHGLTVFDVEELWTHGGSLRIFARHTADNSRPVTDRLRELHAREVTAGYTHVETYTGFEQQVRRTKRKLLEVLIEAKSGGKTIAGYGAPGKGNTLLNHCAVREDLLEYTVDRSPYKQGMFLPGTHIPIHAPEKIAEDKPDYVLVLPWNLRTEISAQLAYVKDWGGSLVYPIPALEVE